MPDIETTRLIEAEARKAEETIQPTPKIKTVTYHRLKNLGNYENERLEASAEIQEGDNLEEVLLGLREWVGHQLSLTEDLRKELIGYRNQRFTLIDEIKYLQKRLEGLKGRWIEAKKVLAAHGIEVEDPLCFEEPKTLVDAAEAIEFPPGALPVGVFSDSDDLSDDDDDDSDDDSDDDDDDSDDSPW